FLRWAPNGQSASYPAVSRVEQSNSSAFSDPPFPASTHGSTSRRSIRCRQGFLPPQARIVPRRPDTSQPGPRPPPGLHSHPRSRHWTVWTVFAGEREAERKPPATTWLAPPVTEGWKQGTVCPGTPLYCAGPSNPSKPSNSPRLPWDACAFSLAG